MEKQVSPPVTLFKAKKPSEPVRVIEPDSFDLIMQFGDPNLKHEKKEPTCTDFWMDVYDKVGAWYGWSVDQFLDTPINMIFILSEKIDKKLTDVETKHFLSWRHLELLITLAKAFGGGSS